MAGGIIAVGGGGGDYPGKLTAYVIFACLVSAAGGLCFGYDIGISGGVTTMTPFLKKFFPSVYAQQQHMVATNNQYCKYNNETLTMFTSSLYLAALISSLVASTVTRKLGRKLSMFTGGSVFFVGALINGFAQSVWMLIVGRILLGIGVGFAVQSVPLYVSEMAPYKHRGALNIVFQLTITIGILVANILNYSFAKLGDKGWRYSLGGAMVPAAVISLGAICLPDTPNSLIERGKGDEAKQKLQQIRGVDDVDQEFNDLVAASEVSKLVEHPWRNLRQRKYRPHLIMAILIPTFQQLTGINVVMFYAPVLFNTIGFGADASLMSAVITGGFNAAATLVSIYGADKWGRRFLFLEGGTQMLICQALVAGAIGWKFGVNGNPGELPKWYAIVVVAFICTYVCGFAWSWGPLGWLVPSEIFPLEIRSAAQSINASLNMFFTFFIAQIFLQMLCYLKFGLFLVFAFFVIMMTLFIYFFLPETKNIPIEEMTQVWKSHWYWKKFVDELEVPGVEMRKENLRNV